MKDKCNKIQEEILSSGSEFSQRVRTHCKTCSECRNFLEDWRLLASTELPLTDPPLSKDFEILKHARERSKSIRRRVTLRRLIGYTAAAASMAAAFIVTCSEYNSVKAEKKYLQQWSWNNFESQVFKLDTEVEISRQMLTMSNNNDNALQSYVNNEINLENL
ncbi:hypothetical protein P0136_07390 [Lentisphaerota bacterium ZTH]|nr:hypothetical protein JYG24_01495 [Lentisphaerota bacterium]WET05192.1 hypothetical protein P0136_07390 [Lentisphaerota bacterium ZTH]